MSGQNKAIARRFTEEFWNRGRPEIIDELVADDHVITDPSTPGEYRGREGLVRFAGVYANAIPDLRYTIDSVIEEGDLLAYRWTATGTHRGELAGIPATGRAISVTGVSVLRIRDGRLVEHNVVWDTLGLLRQLGVIPEPAYG